MAGGGARAGVPDVSERFVAIGSLNSSQRPKRPARPLLFHARRQDSGPGPFQLPHPAGGPRDGARTGDLGAAQSTDPSGSCLQPGRQPTRGRVLHPRHSTLGLARRARPTGGAEAGLGRPALAARAGRRRGETVDGDCGDQHGGGHPGANSIVTQIRVSMEATHGAPTFLSAQCVCWTQSRQECRRSGHVVLLRIHVETIQPAAERSADFQSAVSPTSGRQAVRRA